MQNVISYGGYDMRRYTEDWEVKNIPVFFF